MRSLFSHHTPHQAGARARAARIRSSPPEPALAPQWPVLVEARTVTGDRRYLPPLVAALREQASDHLGHLAEVHFSDEGNRVRLVHLWRSPTDLRSFVEEAHRELLAFRAGSGGFPTVERTLWWSTAGAGVTPEEAAERADHLRVRGPGPRAFTLGAPVPPPA